MVRKAVPHTYLVDDLKSGTFFAYQQMASNKAPPSSVSTTLAKGRKKANPLGFLSRISPMTYVYLFIVAAVVFFIVKYWSVLKWLGLAAAAAAAAPFLADGLAAIVGGIGAALTFAVFLFQTIKNRFKGTSEDAKVVADEGRDKVNEVDDDKVKPLSGSKADDGEDQLEDLVESEQASLEDKADKLSSEIDDDSIDFDTAEDSFLAGSDGFEDALDVLDDFEVVTENTRKNFARISNLLKDGKLDRKSRQQMTRSLHGSLGKLKRKQPPVRRRRQQ